MPWRSWQTAPALESGATMSVSVICVKTVAPRNPWPTLAMIWIVSTT